MTGPDGELRVRLTPRSTREGVAVGDDGAIAARVSAPPVEGRANAALERLLADALGLAPSRVSVVRGGRSRMKTVRLEGLSASEALARLRERP